jgi:hypothetical protein
MSDVKIDEVMAKIREITPLRIDADDLAYLVSFLILEYSPDKDAAVFHLGRAAGRLSQYLVNHPEHFTPKEAIH